MSEKETASQASVLTDLGLKPQTDEAVPDKAVDTPAEARTETAATADEKKTADEPKEDERIVKLNKQLKDTRDAFTQERQVNKTLLAKQDQLAKQIEVLTKKVDGTYDEAKDAIKPPSDEDIRRAERIQSSHQAAVEQYGEEFVMKTVWADDAPFRQFDSDPAVQERVMRSKVPILEAIKVVKESETKAKYGSNPDDMLKALEKELKPKLEKQLRAEFEKKGFKFDEVKGLGGVPAASGERNAPQVTEKTFESLFPNFVKTAG